MFDPADTGFIIFRNLGLEGGYIWLAIAQIGADKLRVADFEDGLFKPLRKKGVTTYVKLEDDKPIEFMVPFTQTLENAKWQMIHYLRKPIQFCFEE